MPRSKTAPPPMMHAVPGTPSMPTRFDLYDLQHSIEKLTEAIDCQDGISELKDMVASLGEEVGSLNSAIAMLTRAVEELARKV